MADSEKIVIDLGSVKIDLSIDGGFSTTAKVEEPAEEETEKSRVRSSFALGVVNYSRADLESFRARNERVKVIAAGLFSLADDISPALALQVMDSVRVFGRIKTRSDVKDALLLAGKIL